MSNMYAIKTSTLTALGDAVRSKTGRYIYTDEKTEPFLIATGTTNDLEMIGYDEMQNRNIYALPIDFRTMSAADVATRWYIEYSFETSDGKGPISSNIKFFNSSNTNLLDNVNNISIAEASSSKATISGNKTINVTSAYTMAYLKIGIHPDRTHTISYDVKIWAMDSSGQYINSNKYTLLEMADVINGLDAIPTEALTITGDCGNRFSYDGWTWFINTYGNKITTKNISNAERMFYNSKNIEAVPFDINIASNISNVSYIFNGSGLKTVPYIIGPEKTPPTSSYSGFINLDAMFGGCAKLRYIPDDYFWKMIPNKEFWDGQTEKCAQAQNYLFNGCNSLRELPDITMIGGNWTSGYSCVYYYLIFYCYALNKIVNLPVYGTFSSNALGSMVNNCYRAQEFTFAVNEDGTPKTAQWKNQTLDLSTNFFGYAQQISYLTQYNSGITADKEVKDDATYQALKNDPDWFTRSLDYCRYNHDSAVNTINSLPDCSATGANTIKFKGAAGALTDGGAINTLTETEIAVATAKGWTVSLV